MTASDRFSLFGASTTADVFLELDEQAVVRAAAEQPDALGQLLALDTGRRHHRGAHRPPARAIVVTGAFGFTLVTLYS